MSVGTSDSTVISPINLEAHNPNTINASAASRDDGSTATIPGNTPQKPSPSKLADIPVYPDTGRGKPVKDKLRSNGTW